ncbi:roadblock/LC7 domain-containing protein [Saccharopolyspora sp. K220]|uniref:roadblock/LC7 domain-containing protein n=1 Tax=Saccharopolyspora soli TaxID=2926618 RepID=UPI001F58D777|nr:roadblock/LC7 domain-containing protein [Saccharopolyspora soli]MCI2416636.1 roadblock/LC7 domain-containing protein [Saccharopolyspora soli]
MKISSATRAQLSGMLDHMVQETQGAVLSAALVSADGLVMAHSQDGDDIHEQLAAGGSGMWSIGKGLAAQLTAGAQLQLVLECENKILVLVGAAEGSVLVLVSAAWADIGDVVYAANRLVASVGKHMGSAPRTAAGQQITVP